MNLLIDIIFEPYDIATTFYVVPVVGIATSFSVGQTVKTPHVFMSNRQLLDKSFNLRSLSPSSGGVDLFRHLQVFARL